MKNIKTSAIYKAQAQFLIKMMFATFQNMKRIYCLKWSQKVNTFWFANFFEERLLVILMCLNDNSARTELKVNYTSHSWKMTLIG